ncbi:MAG: hypothetical protein M5U09_18275 [Gammaproteobacteria bacterium]|nr:hypothetical protein [Gammaproteobacteria bacterium]
MALRVLGVLAGWADAGGGRAAGDFPYLTETTIGAFLAFAVGSVWMARRHLVTVARVVLGLRLRQGVDDLEPGQRTHYRGAVALLVGGSLGVVAFGMQLGIQPAAVVGVFTLYFLIVLTLARLRAEAGPAWAFGPDRRPHELLVWLCGNGSFKPATLANLSLLNWFFADVRFATLPSYIESVKIGHDAELRPRHVALIIALATVVAVVFGMIAVTGQFYDLGAATAKTYGAGRGASQRVGTLATQWLTVVQGPEWGKDRDGRGGGGVRDVPAGDAAAGTLVAVSPRRVCHGAHRGGVQLLLPLLHRLAGEDHRAAGGWDAAVPPEPAVRDRPDPGRHRDPDGVVAGGVAGGVGGVSVHFVRGR